MWKVWKRKQTRDGQASIKGNYSTSNCIAHAYPKLEVPATKFQDIKGMLELKTAVVSACKEITASWRSGAFNRNGILFHGLPGNGKTSLGKAIAGSYGYPFFEIKAATIISQWVGETPRGIKESFDFVKLNAPCVLMLDEIDSLISDISKNTSEDKLDVRNTLLTELEAIRKFPVIIVGATNYYDRLNPASIREGRFDFKLEVKNPDFDARIELLRNNLGKPCADDVLNIVAKRYAGFSVKRIIAIAENASTLSSGQIGVKTFSAALRKLQGSSGNALRDVPGLSELCFNQKLSETINDLVSELVQVDELITYGVAPFKGALLVGPPGTGKTALAKAIAKDSGWAFLDVAGPDLLADFSKIDEMYRKALELRPCVIFIDEGTDLIKDRERSPHSGFTNKLLTVIDGFGEAVPDVVFMVATNHGDDVDEAISRRLYRRVDFELPDAQTRASLIRAWSNKKASVGEIVHDSLHKLVADSDGMSAANIQNWLEVRYKRVIVKALQSGSKPLFERHF